MKRRKKSFPAGGLIAGTMVILLLVTAGWVAKERYGSWFNHLLRNWMPMDKASRQLKGEIFGSMPAPTEPPMNKPVMDIVAPQKTRKIVVKMIPQIPRTAKIPHSYWGPCTKCHLIIGGAPPGSQPITPVGKAWEKASTFKKVGPPILPDSTRHHPPSGRCIKCHDIVVEIPI
ncbi:MAG: magnetochrome domain-containing protein [Magnetococcales bacterium]|nr:magnetochrome domain-containing protein [Magnetococcales bacterium]